MPAFSASSSKPLIRALISLTPFAFQGLEIIVEKVPNSFLEPFPCLLYLHLFLSAFPPAFL